MTKEDLKKEFAKSDKKSYEEFLEEKVMDEVFRGSIFSDLLDEKDKTIKDLKEQVYKFRKFNKHLSK